MRALVCKELGPAECLVIAAMPDPEPAAGEVIVDVVAAGLNFPDTLVITGNYQLRPELPFIPGGEGAGIVSAVGENVSEFKVGDQVMFTGAIGAFAEKIVKPVGELIAMPPGMDFTTGAAFLVAYGTSYYALRQCGALQPGETLLVLGAAGGVGLAAVDIGTALGARVIAAASSEEKLDIACRAGAAERINYRRESLKERAKTLTDGKGADVVYDPVGGTLAEDALRATAWNGRFLVVGFASGEIPRIPLNLPLLKNCSIRGVFYGAWAARDPAGLAGNYRELFTMLAEGSLHPLVSRVFALEQYIDAFRMLTGRKAHGKLVFSIREEPGA